MIKVVLLSAMLLHPPVKKVSKCRRFLDRKIERAQYQIAEVSVKSPYLYM